jgi:hypothetical protein
MADLGTHFQSTRNLGRSGGCAGEDEIEYLLEGRARLPIQRTPENIAQFETHMMDCGRNSKTRKID